MKEKYYNWRYRNKKDYETYEQLYAYKLYNIQPTKKHTTYTDWIMNI